MTNSTETSKTPVAEAIHNHHQELLNTVTDHVAAIVNGTEKADPRALVDFLKGDLLPHARGEEEYLYPAVDPLVKAYGQATATMTIDHQFITDYIRQVEDATRTLQSTTIDAAARRSLETRLRHLCLQLEAVLALHLEKEERVYIPLFTKYVPEAEQQRVLDGMHEAYNEGPEQVEGGSRDNDTDKVLDVRAIFPRERHQVIFATFQALAPGQAFILVNDHDPKPLYYQFSAELTGQFSWDYLQQGPEVWRVRIGKQSGA